MGFCFLPIALKTTPKGYPEKKTPSHPVLSMVSLGRLGTWATIHQKIAAKQGERSAYWGNQAVQATASISAWLICYPAGRQRSFRKPTYS